MGAPSDLHFLLDQTFFGFKPTDRVPLHDAIFRLIWYGEGRWDWDTVYNWPIFLRKFYVQKVNEILEKKNEAFEERMSAAANKSCRKSK